MDIKKTKTTTEEIQNFNIDYEDIKNVKDFAYRGSLINSNGDGSQEIKGMRRLGRSAMEELGKITKSKDVSLEIRAKIIHTLTFKLTVWMRKLENVEGC